MSASELVVSPTRAIQTLDTRKSIHHILYVIQAKRLVLGVALFSLAAASAHSLDVEVRVFLSMQSNL